MSNTATAHASSAHEAVRRALADLAEAGRRGCPDGVSAAAMAHAAEVSAQYVAKVLAGDRAASVDFVASLPERAWSAAVNAMRATRLQPTVRLDVKAGLRSTLKALGEGVAFVCGVLDDDEVSPREEIAAEIELRQLRDQVDRVLGMLAQKRASANVVPMPKAGV